MPVCRELNEDGLCYEALKGTRSNMFIGSCGPIIIVASLRGVESAVRQTLAPEGSLRWGALSNMSAR